MDTALGLVLRPFLVLLFFAALIIPLRLLILKLVSPRVGRVLVQPVSDRTRWLTTLGIVGFIIVCDYFAGLL